MPKEKKEILKGANSTLASRSQASHFAVIDPALAVCSLSPLPPSTLVKTTVMPARTNTFNAISTATLHYTCRMFLCTRERGFSMHFHAYLLQRIGRTRILIHPESSGSSAVINYKVENLICLLHSFSYSMHFTRVQLRRVQSHRRNAAAPIICKVHRYAIAKLCLYGTSEDSRYSIRF